MTLDVPRAVHAAVPRSMVERRGVPGGLAKHSCWPASFGELTRQHPSAERSLAHAFCVAVHMPVVSAVLIDVRMVWRKP